MKRVKRKPPIYGVISAFKACKSWLMLTAGKYETVPNPIGNQWLKKAQIEDRRYRFFSHLNGQV